MRKTNAITLGLAAGVLVACYNTNGLTNGGLRCTDGACPSGYSCQIDQGPGSVGHCWKDGTYRADAGKQDTASPTNDANSPACTVAVPPPIESCSPVGAATCNSGVSGFKCVFLAGMTGVNTDAATVCDCSSQHTKLVGQKCTSLPDNCQAGSACVSEACHSVCMLTALGACPTGSTCLPIYGSTTYGYCR
jgi:hypothetical protein